MRGGDEASEAESRFTAGIREGVGDTTSADCMTVGSDE
jgi:hypothetical protein